MATILDARFVANVRNGATAFSTDRRENVANRLGFDEGDFDLEWREFGMNSTMLLWRTGGNPVEVGVLAWPPRCNRHRDGDRIILNPIFSTIR